MTRPLRLTVVTALGALASAGLLGACGGSNTFTIDHNVVQNAIEVGVAQQQHVLSIVTCPPGIKVQKGTKFTCTVTFANGTQAPVTVTAIDDKGDVRYSGLNGYVHGHPRR